YLVALPRPPFEAVAIRSSHYVPVRSNAVDVTPQGGGLVSDDANVNALYLEIVKPEVCEALAQIARGRDARPFLLAGNTRDFNDGISYRRSFDCLWKDMDGNGR